MKALIAIVTILGAVSALQAQVAPEGISPRKLSVSGTLFYAAQYSQMASFYSNGGNSQMTNISGNFGYSTTSQRHPTSISLGAGDSWTISGAEYNSGPYESLALTQGFVGEYWSLQLSDGVSYFKGVPFSEPNTSSTAPESVVTLSTTTVNNNTSAECGYKLGASMSLSAGGGWSQIYYPNGGGINTYGVTANVGLTRRLDARDSLVGQYAYFQYSYASSGIDVYAETVTGGWSRTWSRHVTTSIAAGPQWVSSSDSSLLPSSTGVSANASISYSTKFGAALLSYAHSLTGGGGYMYGAETDTVTGNFTRQFGHRPQSQISLALSGGYSRSSSLVLQSVPGTINGVLQTKYGTAQAGRHLGRLLSISANYTATDQTDPQASTPVFNGLWQSVSLGIGFTPPQIHLRH